VRHALGATLLDARRAAEAEAVYRRDLEKHPHNGWSLYGLSRALRMQQKLDEAEEVSVQFQKAWRHADVKLTSSCFCLPVAEQVPLTQPRGHPGSIVRGTAANEHAGAVPKAVRHSQCRVA
jgi:hypothetical protein